MGDENPICTLGDYSRPSHEGYRNTIELPDGNNMAPLRSNTIQLVQNRCSFHELRSEDPNQHLKDFLKLVDLLDLDVANRERMRLRESLSEAWTRFKDLLQKVPHYGIDLWLQEAFEDLVMNSILDQEEKVKQLEEYKSVIGNDFIQLSLEVIAKLKDEPRMEENKFKKIEKNMRYPDTEDLEPLSDCKSSETLTKKASSDAPKFMLEFIPRIDNEYTMDCDNHIPQDHDIVDLFMEPMPSQDEIPPPPPPPPSSPQTPTQQTPHTVSTIKLPILKKGEYDIWAMKMEHYLAHTDYPIWEVIQNGNGPVSITTDTQGQIKVLPPRTAEEIVARERERKARTTLLMALPEDHLAKFHKMTDAKEMWDAIKSRFGGNDESKKMQKYILKQQFEGFSVSNSEGLHKGYDRFQSLLSQLEIHGAGVSTEDANQKFLRSLPSAWSQVSLIMRTKPGVDSLSFDDLYNNLRVFESDVKGSTASSSSTQNVAFVSENTSSTNDVSTAYSVSNTSGQNPQYEQTSSYSLLANQSSCPQLDHEDLEQLDEYDLEEMDLKWQVAMISMRMKKFYKKTGRKLQFDAKEPVGFDKTKVECYNCHKTGHFARECRIKGNQDNRRRDAWNSGNKDGSRTGKKEDSKALVTIDGEGVDWTSHSEEDEDYALMACNSSESDTEVTSCSNECKESYAKLKKLYDVQREQLSDASIEIKAYTQGLKKVEAQLVSSPNLKKPNNPLGFLGFLMTSSVHLIVGCETSIRVILVDTMSKRPRNTRGQSFTSREISLEERVHGFGTFDNVVQQMHHDTLATRPIYPRNVIDWEFLASHKLSGRFFESIHSDPFSGPKWANLFQINKCVYRKLVCKFFASTEFESTAFRIGLYSEDQSREDNTLSKLRRAETVMANHLLMEFWPSIEDGNFVVEKTSVSAVRDPRVKLAHRCIATTILGRKDSTQRITEIDLFYLYYIYAPGLFATSPIEAEGDDEAEEVAKEEAGRLSKRRTFWSLNEEFEKVY
ncbi:ribonuclease H-like domain-containing protein [Tanacetum coccineum]